MVAVAHARVDPRAVVVHLHHATIACGGRGRERNVTGMERGRGDVIERKLPSIQILAGV